MRCQCLGGVSSQFNTSPLSHSSQTVSFLSPSNLSYPWRFPTCLFPACPSLSMSSRRFRLVLFLSRFKLFAFPTVPNLSVHWRFPICLFSDAFNFSISLGYLVDSCLFPACCPGRFCLLFQLSEMKIAFCRCACVQPLNTSCPIPDMTDSP